MTIRSWGSLSIALKFAALSIPPSRLCLRPGLLPVFGCPANQGSHLQRYFEPCEYSRESDRGARRWRRQFLRRGFHFLQPPRVRRSEAAFLAICLFSATEAAPRLYSQSLMTIDTFTVNPSGGVFVPTNLIQGSDGNLYATTLSLPTGSLELLRITHAGAITMNPVAPVTDCLAILEGLDGNLYGLSSKSQSLCQITPDGTSTSLPSLNQALIDNNISPGGVGSLPIQGSDGSFYAATYTKFITSVGVIGVIWKMTLSGDFTITSTFPSAKDEPFPYSVLLQGKDSNLYGTTTEILFDGGTVFKVTNAGTMTVLHTFTGPDGSYPSALVWASDGSLYGTTVLGGASNDGTFFKIDPTGAFSALYNFQSTPTSSLYGPTFVQGSDGNFYGLQSSGGANGDGALFRLTPAGDFSVAYDFTQSNKNPTALINGSDGKLYGITDNASQATGTLFQFTTGASPSAVPTIATGGVISADAFGAFTSVAPGSWIEIYGSNFASDTRGWQASDFTGINAPTSLDGTSVTIGGQKAFIDYISPGQVNALVPSTVAMGSQQLTVTSPSGTSTSATVTINAVEPGLLAPPNFNINGTQYVAAIFSDGTFALPAGAISGVSSRPAKPGDEIVLYGVGFGPVTPDIPAGQLAQQSNTLTDSLEVSVGGIPAKVDYDGLAYDYTGLYQINITVPEVAAGNQPVTFTVNGTAGTQTLAIAVGN